MARKSKRAAPYRDPQTGQFAKRPQATARKRAAPVARREPPSVVAPRRAPSSPPAASTRARGTVQREVKTLLQTRSIRETARVLGVAPSTVARWRDGDFKTVKHSTKKLSNVATKERAKTIRDARRAKAVPVTGVPVIPRAERVKRKDYTKLNQPILGTKKKYRKETLPLIDADTVSHDVSRMSIKDTFEVLKKLRDRGSIFRVIFQTPKGDPRYPDRRGSTSPINPEGMDDPDLYNWLINDALKGAGYKPLFIMEMD